MELKTTAFVLLCSLGLALASEPWESFKSTYGREYESEEEHDRRMDIFHNNLAKIDAHNKRFSHGFVGHYLAVNHLADRTTDEIVSGLNGFKIGSESSESTQRRYMKPLNFERPDEVDWRKKGYVTGVKDQGQCGSCWAFSTTGSLEGQHFRKKGTLVSLSEQNLVDCAKEGNKGCAGGGMDQSFEYIDENNGIDTEESYPYEAKDGKCRFKKASVGAHDKGFIDVESGNEDALADAIASEGPISVAIDASQISFHFYSGGVYYEEKCSSTELDHAVLAVGYGSDDGNDFYLVKNSWGTGWGIDGYVKMSRHKNNNCGIATFPSYPVV